jgi:ATP-dependent helicase/nuclease subunit B
MVMPITRKFIDWKQPALPAVADYLRQRYRRGDTWDLDGVVLVFPGGRAGRRLLEVLVEDAAKHELILLPARTCTVGQLPELLYESKRPFATELVQRLAWVQTLKKIGAEACRPFIPHLPAEGDYANWMELGALLQRQHHELAADALNFAEVARRGHGIAGFREAPRWTFLSTIQTGYLTILDQLGLWDLQTARLFAIEHFECRTDNDILLVGTTDMNVATRRMLDQVADRVTTLVHAPAALADRFDEHGCLVPDRWQEAPIDIRPEQLRVVEGPADQAEAVVATIAGYGGQYRADQIVVGVLDEQLVPHLLRRLQRAHLPARWVVGKTLRETAPYRLLAAVSALVQRGRFAELAALVRHPDVASWLESHGASGNWLAALDDYYCRHLPSRMGHFLGAAHDHVALQPVSALMESLAEPLSGSARPLAQWAAPIARVLASFYGDRVLTADDPDQHCTLRSLEQFRNALCAFQQIPADVSPPVDASQAIAQLLKQVEAEQIPSTHKSDQIELLGWLELPLDAAPALVATSFNEGYVPKSVSSDLFLPNALRQQLDLLDNRRRYARDAYALSVLLASRQQLTLIAGRRTAEGDPLVLSRLAFATDAATMARRALAFFRAEEVPQPRGVPAARAARKSGFVVRRPARLEQPITTINVTAFRSYLACPYRFYLQHVVKLASRDDAAEELGADTFGTLLHEVLGEFGSDPIHRETNPDKIRRFLHHTLNRYVTRHYGAEHLPALAVQIVQARHRLDAFAVWQASRTRDGWEIKYVETSGGAESACLELGDGISMTLCGRIDRIDQRDDRWAILDYKTGDTAKTPEETHRKSHQWVDLQLPLYIRLARTLGCDGPLQLGYIVLPKDVAKVDALMAEWDAAMLASAEQRAREVALAIYRQEFWPPSDKTPEFPSEFAAICQDEAFCRNLEEDLPTEDVT